MIGKTISHYKILSKLGEGGMGVVYKAEDTELERKVAIKFLPQHIGTNTDERVRFKVEAKAAAGLNHPNIATIYSIEEVDDEMFIVMEYIDGQELKDKIEVSPLAIDATLNLAIQIAEGLQAAHEKGVVHRDIKSANIMITDKGQVKIMDFGLAKVRGGAQVTKVGTTLGTVAYMSPEQARGEETNHRSDIWSFGVVLYEMFTGQLPYHAEYEQAVIYSILNEDPESITGLRADVPDNLVGIINRAMTRDPDERYQDMSGILTDLKSGLTTSTAKFSTQKRPSPTRKILAGGVLVVFLFLLGVGYFYFRKATSDLRMVSTRPLTNAPGFEGLPSWSPDGARIAYTSDESGRQDIWVRQIRAGQSVNLTKDHSGNNIAPAWSPDGEWIAFFSNRAEGGLFAMPALGGNARQIFSNVDFWLSAASWSPDASELAFIGTTIEGLYTISSQGGDALLVFQGPGLRDPAWSPDGERIAVVKTKGIGVTTSKLWTVKADGTNPRPLTDATNFDHSPVWAADGKHILFVSDRGGSSDIWRMPIDENGGADGPAKALTTGVGVGAIALSADGSKLAYEKIVQSSSIWSMPIVTDRPMSLKDGRQILSENSTSESIGISRDGEWLAFDSNRSGNMDIWMMRKDGSDLRQITTDPEHDWGPNWSPDGKQIAFFSLRSGNRDIWVKPVAGGPARQLTTDPSSDRYPFWSPNSNEIVFSSERDGYPNIWVLIEGVGKPRQVTFHKTDAFMSPWSPDGERLVFGSPQSGKSELYLISPNTARVEQLTRGEFQFISPVEWSPDGDIIYAGGMRDSDITLNFYAISVADGAAKKLTNFESDVLTWGATSDGERFYFLFNEQKSDIWIAELVEEK